MKIQINRNGSWGNMLEYDDVDDALVRTHAAQLASIAHAKLRVLNDAGRRVASWTPAEGWREE